jgi:hypothetical protein
MTTRTFLSEVEGRGDSGRMGGSGRLFQVGRGTMTDMTDTDTDTDFSATDAAGLAAWFARADCHAARLRRSLLRLGQAGPWADPVPMPQEPKSDPVMSRAGGGHRKDATRAARYPRSRETAPGRQGAGASVM